MTRMWQYSRQYLWPVFITCITLCNFIALCHAGNFTNFSMDPLNDRQHSFIIFSKDQFTFNEATNAHVHVKHLSQDSTFDLFWFLSKGLGYGICITLVLSSHCHLGSLSLTSCESKQIADWYTIFFNPKPDYVNTLHCTQEAVYPL